MILRMNKWENADRLYKTNSSLINSRILEADLQVTRGELMVLSWGKGPCQDLARNADNGLDDFLFVIPILAQSPAHMTPSHPQTRHRSFCLSRWEEARENELREVGDSSWLWICSRLATNGFRCLTLINWRARQSRAWCWSYLRPIN